MSVVLVIGFGNTLRTDDGLGWHAAERLSDDPRMAGVTVMRLHQLGPEQALDFSAADLVVLVDASRGPAAGTIAVEHVEPADGTAAATPTWTHHVSPAGLVALARELYGRCAEVFQVGVGVESVEAGDGLSPVVEAALPRVVDAVVDFMAGWSAEADAVQPAIHADA